MKRSYRVIGMIALCFFLAGCSGYQQVAWRTPEQAPEEEEPGDRGGPQAGDKLRVTLVTGERIEGAFVSSSADSIDIFLAVPRSVEVGTALDIDEGELRKIPLNDIASIEKKTGVISGLAILGALIFVGFIAGAAALSFSYYSGWF